MNSHQRRSRISALVAATALLSVTVEANRHPAVFRSGVDLVHLSLVVTDEKGRYATNLDRAHFAVFENGVPQDIEFFSTATLPLDLAVLLDTSVSMTAQMPIVREAAAGLVGTLRAGDRGMIMGFSDTARVLAPFTGDLGRLKAAIECAETHGDTAFYTALYVALQTFGLRHNTPEIRRRAMMVLSDGQDTASPLAFDDVIALARRAGVSIYTVSLGPRHETLLPGQRRRQEVADFEMRALARESGARAFFPTHATELPQVYRNIVDELAHQYVLGYVSKNASADGTFRRVAVRVIGSAGGFQTRARSGYTAPRAAKASAMER